MARSNPSIASDFWISKVRHAHAGEGRYRISKLPIIGEGSSNNEASLDTDDASTTADVSETDCPCVSFDEAA
jgi:hypothetical protein